MLLLSVFFTLVSFRSKAFRTSFLVVVIGVVIEVVIGVVIEVVIWVVIEVVIGLVGGAIFSSPVALPAAIVIVGGYLALAGSIVTGVSQTAVEKE